MVTFRAGIRPGTRNSRCGLRSPANHAADVVANGEPTPIETGRAGAHGVIATAGGTTGTSRLVATFRAGERTAQPKAKPAARPTAARARGFLGSETL